jgi:hypothetical protein
MLDWEITEEVGEFDSALRITAENVSIQVHLDLSDERGLLGHLLARAKERGDHLTL